MGQFDEILAAGVAKNVEQDKNPVNQVRKRVINKANNALMTHPGQTSFIADNPIQPGASGRPAMIPPTMSTMKDGKEVVKGAPGYVVQDERRRVDDVMNVSGLSGTGGQVMKRGEPKKPDVSADVKKYAKRREAKRAAMGAKRRGQTGSPNYASIDEEAKKNPAAAPTSQQLDAWNQQLDAYLNPPRGVDTDAERLSQIHAETDFSAEEEKSGSPLRSMRGVTYDINDSDNEELRDSKARGYAFYADITNPKEKWRKAYKPGERKADEPEEPYKSLAELNNDDELLAKSEENEKRHSEVRAQVESEKKPSLTSMLGKAGRRDVEDVDNPGYTEDATSSSIGTKDSDVDKNPDKNEDSYSDKQLMSGAKEYAQKNAKKSKTGIRVSAQGRKGSVGGKAGETSADVNKDGGYEDPWDSKGNVKSRYNDFENHPELTTTIQEHEIPESQLKSMKTTGRLAGVADNPHIGPASSSDLDLGKSEKGDLYEAGSSLIKNNANIGRQMRNVYVEPTTPRMRKGAYDKPKVNVKKGIPIRDLYETSSEEEPQDFKDVIGDKKGNPITTDEARQKAAQEARGPKTGTHVLVPGALARPAQVGPSEEQAGVAASKRAAMANRFGEDYKDTRQEDSTIDRAKAIAARDGFATKREHLDSPNWWNGPKGQLVTAKAKLLGHFGMGDDASEEKFDTALGGRSTGEKHNTKVENQIMGMYENLKNSEGHAKDKSFSFKDGKEVSNDPNLKESHFRTSNGAVVPMSQTNHPEHPLKGGNGTLTGSLAPLKVVDNGVVKNKHRGWSVSTVGDKRIFEKNPDTVSGTPMSEIDKQGIENGLGPEAHLKNVMAGKETGVTVNGKDTAQIAAERKDSESEASRGASGGKANSIATQIQTASEQIHDKMNKAGVPVSAPSKGLSQSAPAAAANAPLVENRGFMPRDLTAGVPTISTDEIKASKEGKVTRTNAKKPSFKLIDNPTPDEQNAAKTARGEKKSDTYARTREVRKTLKTAGVPAIPSAAEARNNFQALAPKTSNKKVSAAHADINEAVAGKHITAEEGYELKYPKKSAFK